MNTKALKERVSGYILNLDTWLFDRIKRLEVLDSPLNPEVSDGICEPGQPGETYHRGSGDLDGCFLK